MKYFFISAAFFLYGCTGGTNTAVTNLLTEQNKIEDSIRFASFQENYYMKKALAEEPNTHRMKKSIDSSLYFLGRGQALKKKLAPVAAAIDSLTKMK